MNQNGQAFIETAFFFMVLAILFGGLISFTQWFLIRQKLITATRHAAVLYSAGRFTKPEIKRSVVRYLATGKTPLKASSIAVSCEPLHDFQGAIFRLDEVRVRYQPAQGALRYFSKPMEERCVIKHSAKYVTAPFDRVAR